MWLFASSNWFCCIWCVHVNTGACNHINCWYINYCFPQVVHLYLLSFLCVQTKSMRSKKTNASLPSYNLWQCLTCILLLIYCRFKCEFKRIPILWEEHLVLMLAIENRKTKASIFYFIPSDTISFERTYSYSWWSLMIPPKCRCDYQIYYWKSNIVIAKRLLCIWWTKVDRIIRSMAPPSGTRDVWYQGKALPL